MSIGGYGAEGGGGRIVTVASSHKHTKIINEYKKFGYTFALLNITYYPPGNVKDNGKAFSPISSDHGNKFGEIARHRHEAPYTVSGFRKYSSYSEACHELYKVTDTINARSYNWWDSIKAIIFG